MRTLKYWCYICFSLSIAVSVTFILILWAQDSSYYLQIFGGVGIACLPLGLIVSFIRRPKAVITRSQYIKVFLFQCIIYIFTCDIMECICSHFAAGLYKYNLRERIGSISGRKQLNWLKKQENLRKQLMHFTRKKGVVVREENGAKMWKA